jgi:hypothetical protein
MRDRHRFRPDDMVGLEGRLLLSRAARSAPVIFARSNIPTSHADIVFAATDQVNQAFDSFTSGYLQVQGTYFASDPAQGANAAKYFRSYIVESLGLLDQKLTRTFTTLPGSSAKHPSTSPNGSTVLQDFLAKQINGKSQSNLLLSLAGTNVKNSPIPPIGTSGPVATLYTEQALSAIETARAATLNQTDFLILHSQDKGHSHR